MECNLFLMQFGFYLITSLQFEENSEIPCIREIYFLAREREFIFNSFSTVVDSFGMKFIFHGVRISFKNEFTV